MAAEIDSDGKRVVIDHISLDRSPAMKIAVNVEAQRIAAKAGLPTRQYGTLLQEFPEVLMPAHGLAELRRALGPDTPKIAEFLDEWTVEMRPDPTEATTSPSEPDGNEP